MYLLVCSNPRDVAICTADLYSIEIGGCHGRLATIKLIDAEARLRYNIKMYFTRGV